MIDLKNKSKKPKGFTLIEVLLVVFLIGILATAAITSYVNSTTTFKFLSSYQQVTSALRTARSNALSNEQQGGVMPKRYGVCIGTDGILTFADTGSKELSIDFSKQANIDLMASISEICKIVYIKNANGDMSEDTILADKSFNIGNQGYEIKSVDPKLVAPNNLIKRPLLIFHESGTGNLTAFDGSGKQISKLDVPYIGIEFDQLNGDLKKYIRVYQISGLVEESPTL